MEGKEVNELFSGFKGEEGDLIPLLQRSQERLGVHIRTSSETHIQVLENVGKSDFRCRPPSILNSDSSPLAETPLEYAPELLVTCEADRSWGEAVERHLGISPGQTTLDRRFDFQRVACLGCCALAPVIQINKDVYSRMTVTRLREIVQRYD